MCRCRCRCSPRSRLLNARAKRGDRKRPFCLLRCTRTPRLRYTPYPVHARERVQGLAPTTKPQLAPRPRNRDARKWNRRAGTGKPRRTGNTDFRASEIDKLHGSPKRWSALAQIPAIGELIAFTWANRVSVK